MKEPKMQTTDLNELPNIHYKKFFDQFKEINTLPINQWKVVHLIGYFAARYQKHYNTNYTFRFNTPQPSRCYEVFQIKKLSNMLSSDPEILKNYIDWFFEKKIIEKKKRITSMAFLTDQTSVNEYKFNVLLATKVSRSSALPNNILNVVKEFDQEVKTYGDLTMIKNYIEKGNKHDTYSNMLNALKNNNIDLTILDKVV